MAKRQWNLAVTDELDQAVRVLAVRQRKSLVATVTCLCRIGSSQIEALTGESIIEANIEDLRRLDARLEGVVRPNDLLK